jgi:hypothetical protein
MAVLSGAASNDVPYIVGHERDLGHGPLSDDLSRFRRPLHAVPMAAIHIVGWKSKAKKCCVTSR